MTATSNKPKSYAFKTFLDRVLSSDLTAAQCEELMFDTQPLIELVAHYNVPNLMHGMQTFRIAPVLVLHVLTGEVAPEEYAADYTLAKKLVKHCKKSDDLETAMQSFAKSVGVNYYGVSHNLACKIIASNTTIGKNTKHLKRALAGKKTKLDAICREQLGPTYAKAIKIGEVYGLTPFCFYVHSIDQDSTHEGVAKILNFVQTMKS